MGGGGYGRREKMWRGKEKNGSRKERCHKQELTTKRGMLDSIRGRKTPCFTLNLLTIIKLLHPTRYTPLCLVN